jgi:uncharacterized protein YukE
MSPPFPVLEKPPYPEENDRTIREFADLPVIGHEGAIEKLNTIKNDLFGHAEKVLTLANSWATSTILSNSVTNLSAATDSLTPFWKGRAGEAFTNFSRTMIVATREDQASMQAMGKTLANCANQVYASYGKAIEVIGTYAGKVSSLLTKLGLSAIPGAGVILLPSAINDAVGLLDTFVSEVAGLISHGVTQIGQYKENGVGFNAAVNQFRGFEAPNDVVYNPQEWQQVPGPN